MKDINVELNEFSSVPGSTDNKRIFKPGDEYFALMQDSVLTKISNNKQKNRIFSLYRISAIAAAVALILSVFVLIDSYSSKSQELSVELVYDYLYDNINYIDEDMIISLVDEDIFEPGAFIFDDPEEAELYLEQNPEFYDYFEAELFY